MTDIEFITTLNVEGEQPKSYINLVGIPALPIDGVSENFFEFEITNPQPGETFTLEEVDKKNTATIDKVSDLRWKVRSNIMENYKFKVVSSIANSRNDLVLDLDFVVEDADTGIMISPAILRDRARMDFETVAGKLRTVSGLFKIMKNNKLVGVANLNMLSSYPFAQLPKTFMDTYKEADITIDKDMFKDYKFEYAYIFKDDKQTYPAYSNEIDRLVAEDQTKLGKDRLVYCFSVRDKISASSRSFFFDNVTKNLICIQGLDLLLSDDVKITTVVGDSKVNVMKIDAYHIGYKNNLTTTDTSIAAPIPNDGNGTIITPNVGIDANELKKLLIDNNTDLKACIVAIPSSSMQTGRDATYPQSIAVLGQAQFLKANTPPTLYINLGQQANLTMSKEEDNIPNCIIAQNDTMNNFYLRANYSTCDSNSNFGVFLPLY